MQITIATWNIAGGRPTRSDGLFDYAPEDLDYFAEQLRSLDADVVCLQETHVNTQRSVAALIASKLGYFLHETSMSPSHVDKEYSLGNAVLYKKAPKSIHDCIFPYPSFPLTRADGVPTIHHDKGFQVMEFDFGVVMNLQMQPLRFLGTAYDSENGLKFAKEMEESLLKEIVHPSVLCGDFNFRDPIALYPRLLSGYKNVLPSVPTRPEGKKSSFIFTPTEFAVLDSGVIKTNTDHFLCYARIEAK